MQRKILSAWVKRNSGEDSVESTVTTDDLVESENDISSRLNYFSDEFNRVDDLDDNVDNYRTFEPLAGIVTSDMRFHEKRKRRKKSEQEIRTEPSEEVTAESAAIMGGSEDTREIQPLTVVSEGRVLIIDADLEKALNIAEFLNNRGMHCLLCTVDAESGGISLSQLDSFPLIEVAELSVRGGFGGFTATVAGMDTASAGLSSFTGQLSGLAGHNGRYFDLVLDMQDIPSYMGDLLPLGYYATTGRAASLEIALQEIPELRGRFKKPRFVALRKDRCLHNRHRLLECRRCIEICPVKAIKGGEEGLIINHYICQGCGGCSLVCPADAIESFNPRDEELLSDLFRQLQEQKRQAGCSSKKNVVLYDRHLEKSVFPEEEEKDKNNLIYLEVTEMGRIEVAVILTLLAGGAGSITLVCERKWSDKVRHALERQVEIAREILTGLQFSPDILRLISVASETSSLEKANVFSTNVSRLPDSISPLQLSVASPLSGRKLLQLAAGHLAQAQGMVEAAVELSTGAPFGTIEVDETCSLCMACVGTCPGNALAAGGNVPRLFFAERRCHQCGLCASVCPESAVRLRPRLLCTTEVDASPALLKEVEAAECVECGKPFASKAMVGRMQEKLSGHWMYGSDGQLRRLQMCAVCRTRDALHERGNHDDTP